MRKDLIKNFFNYLQNEGKVRISYNIKGKDSMNIDIFIKNGCIVFQLEDSLGPRMVVDYSYKVITKALAFLLKESLKDTTISYNINVSKNPEVVDSNKEERYRIASNIYGIFMEMTDFSLTEIQKFKRTKDPMSMKVLNQKTYINKLDSKADKRFDNLVTMLESTDTNYDTLKDGSLYNFNLSTNYLTNDINDIPKQR